MKKIITLILLVSMLSCTKEKKVCWQCEILAAGNQKSTTANVCNDGETPRLDAPYGFVCHKN